MLKKKIRRPLRIFTKADVPYIIYKSKKYNIKSTEIKDILKFINKLHKKTTKKIETDKNKKKDIKTYINEKIKLEGGPTNVPSTQNVQNIEKETFLRNELNDTINKSKLEQSVLKKEINNLNQSIINKENDISILKIKKNKYKNDTSNISKKSNDLSIIKQGDFEEELNNEMNMLDDLKNEIKNKEELKQNLDNEINKLQSKLKQSKFEIELKDTVYNKKFNKLEDEKQKIEGEKKNIEQEKENFQSLTKLQQQSILNKQQKLQEKEQELQNKQKDINRKERYINYNKDKTNEDLNIIARGLFNIDRDSTAKFTALYNNFYNLQDQPKYQKTQKVNKEDYINFILDKEDQIANQQGNGKKINDFGLWNYQIDKIMEPFKLYIKTITLDELDEIIKYIYDNKILIGSFILNTGNHWTAIYYDFTNEFVLEYYDPFGEPPKSIIIKSFKDLILKLNIEVFVKFKINRVQQQNIKTSNCGWFSMYYLIMRYNNYTFKYITKFKSVKQEEQNIEQLKDKYDKFGFL
jgi:hypothetical protein